MEKAGRFLLAPGASSEIVLPVRSTSGSAGYDFYSPEKISIPAHSSRKFNTGVVADIREGYVLLLFPRSSLGMKGIRIANTVGVIDSDYKLEICCMLENDSKDTITIEPGDRYMQGVFVSFAITEDDNPTSNQRKGGMGSTGV